MNETNNTNSRDPHKTLLDLCNKSARAHLLKTQYYCNFDLPTYFNFDNLLSVINEKLNKQPLHERQNSKSRFISGLNHDVITNKDGRNAWRRLSLVHPVCYVDLVHTLTSEENWDTLRRNLQNREECANFHVSSIPGAQNDLKSLNAAAVSSWWQDFEIKSLELSLEFEYMLCADISRCYESFYTHSIPWSIHGMTTSKNNKHDSSLLGNKIDTSIQDLMYGQTNGIPQGSVLMDLIAEVILGYLDRKLHRIVGNKANFQDSNYHVLRYRDDYRIFTNELGYAESILYSLSKACADLGLHLNQEKTSITRRIVESAVKQDKIAWEKTLKPSSLHQYLLVLNEHADKFPNSGSVIRGLQDFRSRLETKKCSQDLTIACISLAVEIAIKAPRAYPHFASVASSLIANLKSKSAKQDACKAIIGKFKTVPNTGLMDIWPQRITLPLEIEGMDFDEKLCKKVENSKLQLWDCSWLDNDLGLSVNRTPIIDSEILENMKSVVPARELDLFPNRY